MTKTRKFIPATYDYMFKEIIQREDSREWLCHIISDITQLDFKILFKCLKLLNTTLPIENKNSKRAVTDVILTIGKIKFNLEMNKYYYEGLVKKNQYYLSRMKTQLVKKGKSYLDIGEIIQILFNEFNQYNSKELVDEFVTMNPKTGIIEKNDKKYYVNLPILKEKCYNKDIKKLTRLEKNLILLFSDDIELLEKVSEDSKYRKRVLNILKELNEDEIFIGMFDYEEEKERETNTRLIYAENVGMEKGIEKNQIEIVKELLKKNMSVNFIMDVTKLDKETIEKIINIES